MELDDIAQSIRQQRLMFSGIEDESMLVTRATHPALYVALAKEGIAAWHMKKVEVTRDLMSLWEFTCRRGQQHKHLHHAAASFAAFAYHAYAEHLKTHAEWNETIDVEFIRPLFFDLEHCDVPLRRKVIGGHTTTNDCAFYYVCGNIVHHVRIHMTMTRGVANNFCGTLQTIAHQYTIDRSVPKAVADIKQHLQQMIYETVRYAS